MPIYKNAASQKVPVYAWNSGQSIAQTGDASNITAQISIDGGTTASITDTNPTEVDNTGHPGLYMFNLTQSETNGDVLLVSATTTTADVIIDPVSIFTTPGNNEGLHCDLRKIHGDAVAASGLSKSARSILPTTVTSEGLTPTTIQFNTPLGEATTNHFAGRRILFTDGALSGEVTSISGYSLSGGFGQFTVYALTEAPSSGDSLIIV